MTVIDVHHHFAPNGHDNEGRPWSVGMTLDQMGMAGVDVAIGSLPPIRSGARDGEARGWNEWGARLRDDHPDRLGLFATLPLDDTDEALAELSHACDVLRVDGVTLPTNAGDVWLSDDRFLPLMQELDRRDAVVFFHPYATSRCRSLGVAYGDALVSPPWLEFPTNTARLMLGLMVKGVPRRFPHIRFIVAHGGGTMPPLLGRIAGFDGWDTVGPEALARTFPDGVHAEFARFHFDCAQAMDPEAFASLQRLVPASHLLFGSDYSYFPVSYARRQLDALALDPGVKAAIAGDNAAALFPRFSRPRPR